MSSKEVGEALVALCKQGKFQEAVEAFYADEIVSVEAFGNEREARGIDAVRAKMAWFNDTFEINSSEVDGPWVNEPFFIAKYVLDVTTKQSGERQTMTEYAVYEVRDGKVVNERFF